MKDLFSFFDRRKRREQTLDSELRFHIDALIEAKIAEGVPPAEARRQALVEFGGPEATKEECRDVHRLVTLENTVSNLRAAWRFMRYSPGFSLTVILTLALGIGANTAVFSALDGVLFRALPFPDDRQLVVFHQYDSKHAETRVSPVRLEDWNRLARAFRGVTGYYQQDVSETSGALPERLNEALVAPRFLSVLGISPIAGRDFTPEEERFGGPDAVLISNRLWHRRFGADPAAVGKRLHFGNYAYTVIGVMPARFELPDRQTDLWSVSPPDAPYAQGRDDTWFVVLGRLKPRATVAQGGADLAHVQGELARQYPKTDKLTVGVQPLKESIVGQSAKSLWLLFGSVSVLLLIACSNIAALLLARTAGRAREISIRFSLGASHASVVLQLLTECFVLALAGSAFGLFLAGVASSLFRSSLKNFPRAQDVTLNGQIVVYVAGIALLCTLLFGLVPALQATRRGLAAALAQGGRSQVSVRNPLQWTLVAVQVALAVALLIGAALLMRSMQALGRVSPGFDPSHLLSLRISGSWGETGDRTALNNRIEGEMDAIRSVPGVISVATSASLPGLADAYPSEILLESHARSEKILSDSKPVSHGYFETMRIPLLAGRGCERTSSGDTAVVNRSFVDSYLHGQPSIGLHLALQPNTFGSPRIVGVASNARENGLEHAPAPAVYWCVTAPDPSPYVLVRTHGEPRALIRTIRLAIHKVEPARSVFDMVSLEDQISDAGVEMRFRTLLLSLFALTAILLASIGLYGTLSYFVSTRQREVGLRMALGALPQQILARFLKQGLTVSAIGCVTGLGLALLLTRLLASMLFDTSALDPLSYAAVTLLVLLIAILACVVPALRAARLDPTMALRED